MPVCLCRQNNNWNPETAKQQKHNMPARNQNVSKRRETIYE